MTFRLLCLTVLTFGTALPIFASDGSAEAELIALLQSDAAHADKAIACKKLAIAGSSAAVPALADLLPDSKLSSWARIALEAIPGTEADEALRNAAESLDGLLLVGMINSIAVRRDVAAVDLLKDHITNDNKDVASAAAVALGRIANAKALDALQIALSKGTEVASAVGEGIVLCAERLLAEGDTAGAIELYDALRAADVPQQRVVEATRGAILARGDGGIPLLMEQLRSDNRVLFRLALSTAREFPGSAVDQTLADELATAASDRSALIVQAMADRPDTVVLPAIIDAAEGGDMLVRLSAIDALARVGNASCLQTLLDAAVEGDDVLADAARQTLASMPGENVDDQIATRLSNAKGAVYPVLLRVVGDRRIDALPLLTKALNDRGAPVRHAALEALGSTVPLDDLGILTSLVVRPQHQTDSAAAERALRTAAVRMPDREACAEQLVSSSRTASLDTRNILLEILSEVGGTRALQALADAARGDEESQVDVSTRLLGKWSTVEAAPVLLDLAKTLQERKYKVRTLRGYLGQVRRYPMSSEKRAAMCQAAIDAAIRIEEKKLALDVLKLRPNSPGLAVVVQSANDAALRDHAVAAGIEIVRGLRGEDRVDLKEVLQQIGLKTVQLDIVKAEYGVGGRGVDVTGILRQHVGKVALIELPSSSYNESFGGDPAPGIAKQLQIQYRINGEPGEVTLDENSLILLSTP